MKTPFGCRNIIVLFLGVMLLIYGTHGISYAQEANPTITAATPQPLTEATLHKSVVTLTLSGGQFADEWNIGRALSILGIDEVTFKSWDVERVSDTEATVELEFAGNIDTDATLTFTVEAGAIVGYNGNALTAILTVIAVEESLTTLTDAPLTEANLHESVITVTLNGRSYDSSRSDIERALTISGIDGVTVSYVRRVSNTEARVTLTFNGDIDTNGTLTLTVGADAIDEYNKDLTVELPVTAVEESLAVSTESPLTETSLHGSVITLSLSGRAFTSSILSSVPPDYSTYRNLTLSGIEGVTIIRNFGVYRVSATEVKVYLAFVGNIDTDASLTLTVGADAIVGYNKDLTVELPITAVEESLEASTEASLTEVNLHGSTITLTLSGRRFFESDWEIRYFLTLSGIEGATVSESYSGAELVSDKEMKVTLAFSGNIDTDTTLTLTVGAAAIVGYNKDLTVELPVTAVEESLTASTEAPLTEANLHGSIITLTLTGRRFVNRTSYIRDAVSVSGIAGVTARYGAVDRVSDTVATVELGFSGNIDTDATLTFTVGAAAIGYNKDFTFTFPVTAIEQSDATVSISPSPIPLPGIGEKLTLNLDIANGENVTGYQATVSFDPSALRYIESRNGDYLPADTFFVDQFDGYRQLVIGGNTLAEARNGDGTLATITFKVEDFKASTLTLDKVYLVDADGKRWQVAMQSGEVTIPPEPDNRIFGDVNRDGAVNIQDLVIVSSRFGQKGNNIADINGDRLVDIVDLVLVANAFGADAAAPSLNPQILEQLTAADVKRWLNQARQLSLTDPAYLRGITVLKQLLMALTPKETVLLPNYPNPFNPETWIPYHLAKDADVTLHIYAMNGTLVRTLTLGHQAAGLYQNRSRAAYWNGKNELGEKVATGVYFYTLTAGDFSATRKMLIRK